MSNLAFSALSWANGPQMVNWIQTSIWLWLPSTVPSWYFTYFTAGLSGAFANMLIPLQVGARDIASPFMNMLSYWFFFASSVILLSSLFVATGPASGGWTVYPPLGRVAKRMPASGIGMTLWLVASFLFIASSLLGGVNYIATVLNMRTKGMSSEPSATVYLGVIAHSCASVLLSNFPGIVGWWFVPDF